MGTSLMDAGTGVKTIGGGVSKLAKLGQLRNHVLLVPKKRRYLNLIHRADGEGERETKPSRTGYGKQYEFSSDNDEQYND